MVQVSENQTNEKCLRCQSKMTNESSFPRIKRKRVFEIKKLISSKKLIKVMFDIKKRI